MKVIDISAVFGQLTVRGRSFTRVSDMISFMDRYEITDAMAYVEDALRDNREGNKRALELSKESNGRIMPCFVIDPPIGSSYIPDSGELFNILREGKPAAVRLFPANNKWALDLFYSDELFEVFDKMELPVLLDEEQCDFSKLPALLERFKRLKLILIRCGLQKSRYIMPLLKKCKNVYFDTSTMIDVGALDEFVARYGAERFLFSAGIPRYDPCGALGLILQGDFSWSDKEKILGGNFLKMKEGIRW